MQKKSIAMLVGIGISALVSACVMQLFHSGNLTLWSLLILTAISSLLSCNIAIQLQCYSYHLESTDRIIGVIVATIVSLLASPLLALFGYGIYFCISILLNDTGNHTANNTLLQLLILSLVTSVVTTAELDGHRDVLKKVYSEA